MSSNTSERTLYALTPSQGLTVMNRTWCIHRNVVNIPTSIVVNAALDLDVLEKAVRLAVGRWDSFGIRIIKKGKQWQQYFADPGLISLKRFDFRGRSRAEMEESFHREARKVLPLTETPMAKMWVFADPDGNSGVFSVINHLIMDSWAISYFYADVLGVYGSLVDGDPLPKAPVPYESVLVKELAYLQSDRYKADQAYWRQELTVSEPLFTSLKGGQELADYRKKKKSPAARECKNFYLRSQGGHIVKVVSAEDVARCKEFLVEQRFPSMQLLFSLALRTYLAKVNNRTPDVTFGATLARRGTLEEKRTGGSRVHHFDYRTVLPETATFMEALETMLEKQNQHYRHMDFPSVEAMDMTLEAFDQKPGITYSGVLMTFQTLAVTLDDGLTFKTMWYGNGATAVAVYLTVMDDDGTGGLRCYWEHSFTRMPAKYIEEAHDFMVRVIRAGIERPTITLGELMDLPCRPAMDGHVERPRVTSRGSETLHSREPNLREAGLGSRTTR
jgi:hypothetical protein